MSALRAIRRVSAQMENARGRIVGAAALGAVSYVCAIGLLAVAGWLIARASQQPPVLYLTVAAVSVRAFAIGRSAFRYAERLVGHDGAFRGLASLRVLLYERIERVGPARGRSMGRGDLLQRVVGDVDTMQDLPLRVILPWAQAVVVGVFTVIVSWWLLPLAGVAMLVGLSLAATAIPALAMRVAADSDRRVADARGALSAAVLASMQSAVDLRSIGAAQRAVDSVGAIDGHLVRIQLRSAGGAGLASGALALVQGLVVVASAAAGVAGVSDGSLDGVLLAVVALLPLAAFEASLALPTAALTLRRVEASALRLGEILDSVPSDVRSNDMSHHPPVASDLDATHGIELIDAHVRWPGASVDALRAINVVVRPGERLAVVGESGSGKSTLAAALVRFLDVQGGYQIDGSDAAHADADEVRTRVGLLAQEAHVFDTSVEQNLRLVRPDASDEELGEVVQRVHLSEWVTELPAGLAEQMGEGGVRMSGGQRQRIGLARMLLADFDFVVLDEPTENLDTVTADALMDDVFDTFDAAGLVVVSHRMSDALRCDRVMVLEHGAIAALGTPDEVRKTSPWFAEALRLERENHEWSSLTDNLPIGQVVALDGGRP